MSALRKDPHQMSGKSVSEILTHKHVSLYGHPIINPAEFASLVVVVPFFLGNCEVFLCLKLLRSY